MNTHTNNKTITAADVLKIKKRNDRLSGLKWGFIYGLFAGWAMLCLGIILSPAAENYNNRIYFEGYYDGQKSMEPIELTGDLLYDMKSIEIEEL